MGYRYMGIIFRISIVLVIALWSSSSFAACPVTNTFTGGTTAVASEVNANFDDLVTCAEALQDGTGITALDPDVITGDTSDDNALDVAAGGTGRSTSTTAYGLIAAGTTATGDLQTLAAGATTQILVGGGASALPVWTTAQGTGAPVRATSPTLTTPALGAATATTPAADDNDTSVATTAFVQTELAAISTASSTDTAVAKFSGTSGDIQNSGVLIDASNNMTVPGSITTGTSGPTFIMFRDTDDAGYTECGALNGTLSCAVDADGVIDGTL